MKAKSSLIPWACTKEWTLFYVMERIWGSPAVSFTHSPDGEFPISVWISRFFALSISSLICTVRSFINLWGTECQRSSSSCQLAVVNVFKFISVHCDEVWTFINQLLGGNADKWPPPKCVPLYFQRITASTENTEKAFSLMNPLLWSSFSLEAK